MFIVYSVPSSMSTKPRSFPNHLDLQAPHRSRFVVSLLHSSNKQTSRPQKTKLYGESARSVFPISSSSLENKAAVALPSEDRIIGS